MENLKTKIQNLKSQGGQTLIETLAALFILIMGISAAVGLAVYAFNSSTTVTKEIIAAGVARQGIEAVKNMRDSNWLSQTSVATNCYDYASSTAFDSKCYTTWLGTNGNNPFYCLDPTNTNGSACNGNRTTMNYALGLPNATDNGSNDNSNPWWTLYPQKNNNNVNYGMSFNSTNFGGTGFYNQDGATACTSSSVYCRKIIITKQTPAGTPYDPSTYGGSQNPGPLVFVQSQVWWNGRSCPVSTDWPGAGKCSIELDAYLTNWKNY